MEEAAHFTKYNSIVLCKNYFLNVFNKFFEVYTHLKVVGILHRRLTLILLRQWSTK